MTEQAKILDHDYDGIQEYDNRLPNWWLWTFYGAIIFSLFYWLHFHSIGTGTLPQEKYQLEMQEAQARADALAAAQPLTDDSLFELSKDAAAVQAGRETFLSNCVACHLPTGGGSIGPNLTDSHWIHGGQPTDLYRTITKGVIDKQMPAWEPILGPLRCRQLVAFLLTIRDTNVPGGKAPEGKPTTGG